MINDNTGVCMMVSLTFSITYHVSGKSGKLLLNRYCRKTALTSPQIPMSGTWGSSTTLLRLGLVPMLSGWTLAMS